MRDHGEATAPGTATAVSKSRPVGMSTLRFFALVTLAVVVTACSGATKGMPRGWPDLVLASDTLCPNVAGRYFASSDPITLHLAKRRATGDSEEAPLAYFEVSGAADSGLTVTVVSRDSVKTTGSLKKGTEWDGDYFCGDGWLRFGESRAPSLWDADVRTDDFYPKRHAVRIAPNEDGSLVARLDFVDYAELIVWCGDGCKGIPLPGTFETRSIWSLAEQFDPERPPPVARHRERTIAEEVAELEWATTEPPAERQRAQDVRVWQEHEDAENGPPDPEKQLVRKRAVSALVPGMQLLGVGPTQGGWHLSVEFDELYQLEQYMAQLLGSGPVAELKVAPLFRAKTATGRITDVVFIRYE